MTNKTHEQLMETNAVYRKVDEMRAHAAPPLDTSYECPQCKTDNSLEPPMKNGMVVCRNKVCGLPFDPGEKPDALAMQEGGDHYKGRKMQPVEYIEANELPFLEGCIIKRATRHGQKNGVEDLKKIIHEARLIAQLRYGVDI